jgi:hypothetical protein
LQNVLIDGFSGSPTILANSIEVTADIELLTAIAPNLSNILVYESAPNDQNGYADEWKNIADDDIAKIVSTSWGSGGEIFASDLVFDNQIFKQMALQGQAVFVASGDCGSYADTVECANTTVIGANEPAVQPYVTAVGISKLTTNPDGSYNSESASAYSGGGISYFQTIPSYQQGMISAALLGSTTMRNVPDVAFNGDPSTGYAVYTEGTWAGGFAGSSASAPLWAAFAALVNQGRAAANQEPLGFMNPVLYQIAQSSHYANDFHDITTGMNNLGVASNPDYPAGPGYDDATGLGSFNGLNLYNDLVAPAAPTGLTATTTASDIYLSWAASTRAVSYNVKRFTVSGGPYSTIASAVTNTGYADSSVSAGSTYYYVVSGVNFGGEGTNSTELEASATRMFLPPQGFTGISTNGNLLLLQLTGTPNFPYVLQTTTNLTPPIDWLPIVTNPADTNGNWSAVITNQQIVPARFFRAAADQ